LRLRQRPARASHIAMSPGANLLLSDFLTLLCLYSDRLATVSLL